MRREVRVPKLQRHFSRAVLVLSQTLGHMVRQFQNGAEEKVAGVRVLVERRFRADGFAFPIRYDLPIAFTVRQLIQLLAQASERSNKGFARRWRQLAYRPASHLVQAVV